MSIRLRFLRYLCVFALIAIVSGFCDLQPACAQVQHPQAARRIRLHRRQVHRENVGQAVQQRRENVGERRANIAQARASLPTYAPATVVASGEIVFPAAPVVPPVAVQPTAPPASTVQPQPRATTATPPDETEDYGLPSDPLPDAFEGSNQYAVLRIEDGGTTVVLRTDTGEQKVRMIGMTSIAFGEKVKLPDQLSHLRLPSTQTFVENLLKGERVYVVYDTQVIETDADQKSVAYLFRAPDGLLINLEVVRAGFAVVDRSYSFDQQDEFLKYEAEARASSKGIYGTLARLKNLQEAKNR